MPLSLRRAVKSALLLGLATSCGRSQSEAHAHVSADPVTSATSASSVRAPELGIPADQRHEPADLAAGERRPLILFLHGLGSSGKVAQLLGLPALAQRERVFLVAPDGSVDAQGRRYWDAHPACCNFERRQQDDVARLAALLDAYAAEPHVDPKRLYVVGFSNGGFMAHRLGCKLGDRLAAVVSIAGSGPSSDEICTVPSSLSVLEIHGDADEIVRFAGGHLFDRPELPTHASAHETFDGWARRLACRGQPQPGPALDLEAELPRSETTTENYPSCEHGSVSLWVVHGGTHYIGKGPAFREQIWSFLARSSRP